MHPDVGVKIPFKIFKKRLFPAPFGPIITVTSFELIERFKLDNIFLLSKMRVKSLIKIGKQLIFFSGLILINVLLNLSKCIFFSSQIKCHYKSVNKNGYQQ